MMCVRDKLFMRDVLTFSCYHGSYEARNSLIRSRMLAYFKGFLYNSHHVSN